MKNHLMSVSKAVWKNRNKDNNLENDSVTIELDYF